MKNIFILLQIQLPFSFSLSSLRDIRHLADLSAAKRTAVEKCIDKLLKFSNASEFSHNSFLRPVCLFITHGITDASAAEKQTEAVNTTVVVVV